MKRFNIKFKPNENKEKEYIVFEKVTNMMNVKFDNTVERFDTMKEAQEFADNCNEIDKKCEDYNVNES